MEIRNHLSKIYIPAIFAAVLLLTACMKYNPDSKSTSLPVIESYLIPGQPITVRLSQQKSLTDTAVYGAAITGAKVYVSDGAQKVQLAETTAGTYTYTNPAFLVTGKTYSLQFDYLGYNVAASTVMPAKPANFAVASGYITIPTSPGGMSTVLNTFIWSNPDSLNHVLAFKAVDLVSPVNNFANTRPINSQFNTNRVSLYNVTANMFAYRGNYRAILFRVNQEYINLLNNNTRTSSQDLTQIPTNIVNGFGIFTAMQADTLAVTIN